MGQGSPPDPVQPTEPTTPPADVLPARRWSTRRRALLALGLVVLLALVSAVVDALRAPGSDTAPAKLAEWGRDHGLGWFVTSLEGLAYQVDQPPVGGAPPGGIPQADAAPRAGEPPLPATKTLPPLRPLAGGTALPNEGKWQIVVTEHGAPAVQVAYLRPDDKHTSFVVGVMRIDPALIRGELHPGTGDPGGTWAAPTSLTGPAQRNIAAVFNGGFKLSDPSHPGYYSEGRTVKPLRDGAASLVLFRDGHADVGAWNREVRMGPDVASVRQNLVPLVDGGQVSPQCSTGGAKEWGSTVGQTAYVHRSGFGVTDDGAEIYVGGPALSVCTLGAILTDAGVVRGMELDINPAWVSGTYFPDGNRDQPAGAKLFPAEQVAPQHYFSPSSRDWFAWYLRSAPGIAGPARQHRHA